MAMLYMYAMAYDSKAIKTFVYMVYQMLKCPTEGVIYPIPTPEYYVSKY